MIGMDDNGMNEIEQAKQSTIRGIVEDFLRAMKADLISGRLSRRTGTDDR